MFCLVVALLSLAITLFNLMVIHDCQALQEVVLCGVLLVFVIAKNTLLQSYYQFGWQILLLNVLLSIHVCSHLYSIMN